MLKTRKVSILFICLLTILLCACSYKDFEDSLRSKNNGGDEQYSNPTSIPDDSSTADEGALLSIGDTITYRFDDQSIQYTLNKVHVVDHINDLNLDVNDFVNRNPAVDNGEVEETYRFVAVDVTIKNIDFVGDVSEGKDPVLFIESSVGFKDGLEDPNGPWLTEAAYFNEHPPLDQNNGQDYYQFSLPFGDEIDATIGWFLPTDQLKDEKLYYIIGGQGSPEFYQYFELNLD